jgi:hypothetical protein
VTRSWRALAQHVLCSRLCRRDGQPVPTRLHEITDLDVEQLIEAGRPGDAAAAGRMLPGLARLHGYGHVVYVAAVRAADLQSPFDGDEDSLLYGAAKDGLNSCISGEGEAPLRLTIAAVACAGSGVICGVPVQQLREDGVTELDLSNRRLHAPAGVLVAYIIAATSVLENCNLLENRFDVESTTMLAKIGAEKGIMLSGMTRDQTVAKFTPRNLHRPLRPADAILIASDLKFMAVVTTLDLSSNSIGPEGAQAIAEVLKANTVLAVLWLTDNSIGEDGARAIAEALKVNTAVTTLRLMSNDIGVEGAIAIAEALKVNKVLAVLWLEDNSIGEDGAKAIAETLKVNAVLTDLRLEDNSIGEDGARAIAEALKVNTAVTTLDLGNNSIGLEGALAIAEALNDNATLTTLVLEYNRMGDAGAKAVQEAVEDRNRFDLVL